MKTLDLYKVWEALNKISNRQSDLCEQDIFVQLLGSRSNYLEMSFDNFLEHYSFKIDADEVTIFNDDGIPWEDYTNSDFSYIPSVLLSFSAEKLDNWIEIQIKLDLERQEREKVSQKEDIKAQIIELERRLKTL